MTDQLDPTPLFQDLAIDSSLRQDLEAAQGSSVTYDPELGAAAFEAQLATAAGAGSSAGGLEILGWFLGAVVLLGGGALGGQAWYAHQDAETDSAITASLPAGPEGDVLALGDLPKTLAFERSWSIVEPASGAPETEQVQAVSGPKAAAREKRTAFSPPIARDDFANEAAQLQQTRRALTKNPDRALALAEEGHAKFPNGALGQEREGLAILALVQMKQVEQAKGRADRFLAKHPHGPVSARVRRAVETP